MKQPTYTVVKSFIWSSEKKTTEVIKRTSSIYKAFEVMRNEAYNEFEKFLHGTAKAAMQLCSDSNYPDAWGFANNWMLLYKDDNLMYEVGVIETKDIEKYI